MTEHEINKRFKEANAALWSAWEGPTLFRMADELAEVFDYLDEGQLPVVGEEVLDHLSSSAKRAMDALDAALEAVPPTEYAKLRAMYLLAGGPVTWGTEVDLNLRAFLLTKELLSLVKLDEEDIQRQVHEVEHYRGPEAAKGLPESMRQRNSNRAIAICDALQFEVLRILQHFNAAIQRWATKTTPPSPPKPLRDRFPKPEQFEYFMTKLHEYELADPAGNYTGGRKAKGKLVGAYQGAAYALGISTGDNAEVVATLNAHFNGLRLSGARFDDLVSGGMDTTFRHFPWP